MPWKIMIPAWNPARLAGMRTNDNMLFRYKWVNQVGGACLGNQVSNVILGWSCCFGSYIHVCACQYVLVCVCPWPVVFCMFSPVQRSPLHTLTGATATLNPNRKLLIWETSGTIKSILISVSTAGYTIKAACLLSLIAVGIQNTLIINCV